jgi:putative (di)nucleoside polyphosphate hydrolase
MGKIYRPNVAAVIQRGDGCLLIGQRSDFPESWQFPQGGIDAGESPEQAVQREILEEVGIPSGAYSLGRRSGPHRYDFPSGPDRKGFCGQEQVYFLCALRDPAPRDADLAATCGEFAAILWVPVKGFPVHLAPPMKQSVYHQVLRDFFGTVEDWR